MKRLLSTIRCDIRLQARNGFYHAAAFVAAFWTFALSRIEPDHLVLWMPVFILSNILINTFYFMAGLVLLEKAEGTLIAQSVTPLRPWEYLVSKLVTLKKVPMAEIATLLVFFAGVALCFWRSKSERWHVILCLIAAGLWCSLLFFDPSTRRPTFGIATLLFLVLDLSQRLQREMDSLFHTDPLPTWRRFPVSER
jgi:hypothetical protein